MPQRCTICQHDQRAAIDRALVTGEAYRHIAAQYGTSTGSLQRHKEHLPVLLTKAHEAQEVASADDLLAELRSLQERTLALLGKAEEAGRLGTAVMAIREARGNIELLAKLLGELDERPVINLVAAPEWVQIRTVVLVALQPYPEARVAVARALDAGA